MIPREHGSWAVLLAPLLAGFFAASPFDPGAAACFLVFALAGFLTKTPLLAAASVPNDKRALTWLGWYTLIALAALTPLLLHFRRWGLLAFSPAAVGLLIQTLHAQKQRQAMGWFNELAGIAGLALAAPSAAYAARGSFAGTDWLLWLLCVLFFWGPVFHVKLAALQHRAAASGKAPPELERAASLSVVYHAAALAGAAGIGFVLGWQVMVPFTASGIKATLRALGPARKTSFQQLGYQEVGFSLLFVACAAAALRLR